ncbi:MAG: lipid A biosynthesis acyltransferase [Flavisolibacter sp.]|nr:lipid A biosynthesis acyltransferase [Flavisolibacter sp.]
MYHLVYGIIYLFSLLPLRVLYLFSDFFYFLVFYIIGYRKSVVLNNLQSAFPEKSEKERIRIAKQFYKNFIDTLIETVKLFSAGKNFIMRHVKADISIFHEYFEQKQKVQVHMGHNFNWELQNLYGSINAKQVFLGVYMPLENKIVNRVLLKMRSKFGTVLMPATQMRKAMLPYRNETYILGLIADQTPANPDNAYWVEFFGRPTAFLKGPEKGAKAGNHPVVFSFCTKTSRGHYELNLKVLEQNPALLDEGVLTARYAQCLEENIRRHPDMWLWSHRRWKHEWNEKYKIIHPAEAGSN